MRAFCYAVSLTNSFGFCLSFFLGTLKKVSLKVNCFSMVSTRGHSNLISNSYRFLMEKYTIILICFSQHTFPNVSRFFFFFLLAGIICWNWTWPLPKYLQCRVSLWMNVFVQCLKCLRSGWNLQLFKLGSLCPKQLCSSWPHFGDLKGLMSSVSSD